MGWIRKTRGTGWRDVTSDITSGAEYVSGRLLVRRTEGEVTLLLDDLKLDRTGTATFYRLPSGLRPFHTRRDTWWQPNSAAQDTSGTVNISTGGYVVGYRLRPPEEGPGNEDVGSMTARIIFDTTQSWPSTYPGTEVQL